MLFSELVYVFFVARWYKTFFFFKVIADGQIYELY